MINHFWLQDIDKWRKKFTIPLTRKQAAEILLDERTFKDGEFLEPRQADLYFDDFEVFCYEILEAEAVNE